MLRIGGRRVWSSQFWNSRLTLRGSCFGGLARALNCSCGKWAWTELGSREKKDAIEKVTTPIQSTPLVARGPCKVFYPQPLKDHGISLYGSHSRGYPFSTLTSEECYLYPNHSSGNANFDFLNKTLLAKILYYKLTIFFLWQEFERRYLAIGKYFCGETNACFSLLFLCLIEFSICWWVSHWEIITALF